MENNGAIKESKTISGNYVTGIIGGIIGGVIAAIPWIVVYIECNMILSALAILISMGALYGYKICKGKMTKAVKVVVVIITLLVVILANVVVIPNILANKNDYEVSVLYESDEYVSAMMQDLAVSIVFSVIGLSVAITNINNMLAKNNDNSKEKSDSSSNPEEENANIEKSKKKTNTINIIAVVLLVVLIIGSIALNNREDTNKNISTITKVEKVFASGALSVEAPDNWVEFETDYVDDYYIGANEGDVEEIYFSVFDREDFESKMTLEEFANYMEEYYKEEYSEENDDIKTENATIAGKDGYKITFNYTLDGYKYKSTSYIMQTENYIIEADTISSRSKAEEKVELFEEVVNSVKEK